MGSICYKFTTIYLLNLLCRPTSKLSKQEINKLIENVHHNLQIRYQFANQYVRNKKAEKQYFFDTIHDIGQRLSRYLARNCSIQSAENVIKLSKILLQYISSLAMFLETLKLYNSLD
jgi:hypothetical protein